MERFVEFVGNHLILFALLVAILGALVWSFIGESLRGIRSVDHLGLTNLMNRDDALVIDIRPQAEYQRGHILGALHAPESSLAKNLKNFEKHKERPAVVYCQSGMSAGKACKELQKLGFEQVYMLKGGINTWLNANLPLTKD